jgi:uncharacterized membrane protein
MKTRKELKQQSKDLLKGHWGTAILLNIIPTLLIVALIVLVIITAASILGTMGYHYTDIANYAVKESQSNRSNYAAIVRGAVSTVFMVGVQYTFLDWLRNRQYQVEPLRDAFQVFTGRYFWGTIGLMVLTYCYTTLWSMLFFIPGVIKSYSYSQAYLIYKDRRGKNGDQPVNVNQCITISRHMMNGHKWDFFVLQLSFLGWGILSVLTLGIGFLWLNPYKNATYAGFYDDLKQAIEQQASVEPQNIAH